MRGAWAGIAGAALCLGLTNPAPAQDARPGRIISINLCTDQLLLDLAQPGQIMGLSPFAREALRSSGVAGIPLLSGTAEEIMVLKPDLVVSDRYTRRMTRDFLRARQIPLEEFDLVDTIAGSKAQIARFGEMTGSHARARERIAELDGAMAALKSAASGAPLRVLPLSRRGWVTGPRSLVSDVLAEAGLVNAAAELGFGMGGFAKLETIVALMPDAILITASEGRAEDQGRALLLHPAIDALFPPERRIILSDRLTACGGTTLAEAMRQIANQISRLKPRIPPASR